MLKKMLARLVPLPALLMPPKANEPEDDNTMEAYAFLSAVAAAMPRLNPPEPANEDPLAGIHEVVEYALAQAGYLR